MTVIFVAESFVSDLFNPNEWPAPTKDIVSSCASELTVLRHSAVRIGELCANRQVLTDGYARSLEQQWRVGQWDWTRATYFAQVPELHLTIEAFFSSLKALLDLISQMYRSEDVVTPSLDGFHRQGAVYGGKVLNVLKRNTVKGREEVASAISDVILAAKAEWIDDAIQARDDLVHPPRGAGQLMFVLRLAELEGRLEIVEVLPPSIAGTPIDEYAIRGVERMTSFGRAVLDLLKPERAA
ncbi:MAG: hypothetical protein ACRDGT_00330 [Candidatus Limnocylindria bacterium]